MFDGVDGFLDSCTTRRTRGVSAGQGRRRDSRSQMVRATPRRRGAAATEEFFSLGERAMFYSSDRLGPTHELKSPHGVACILARDGAGRRAVTHGSDDPHDYHVVTAASPRPGLGQPIVRRLV